jgi:hypothetical protein
MWTRLRWTWVELFICVLLVGLAAGECAIYTRPLIMSEQSLGISVGSARSAGGSTQVQVEVSHGPADTAIKLAAYPLAESQDLSQPSIFVYNDGTYPTAGVALTVAQGVYDHLVGELSARDYRGQISGLSATQLVAMLKDTGKAKDRMVVIMTGVMPDTAFSRTIDLISAWVRAGGILAWAGGAIGYWNGTRGQALTDVNIVGESGTQRLLGNGVIQYPTTFGREGTVRSDWASALDLAYRFTGAGVLRDAVASQRGVALGWYSGLYASISFLPRGSGGYLIFGGEVPDETSISVDLTKIILSRAASSTGTVAGKLVTLPSTSGPVRIDWSLPFNAPSGRILVIAFDPNQDGVYFATQVVNVINA